MTETNAFFAFCLHTSYFLLQPCESSGLSWPVEMSLLSLSNVATGAGDINGDGPL